MPLCSMTGFGRHVHDGVAARVSVELRTVNHRFAEIHLRIPREWVAFEEDVRSLLSRRIARGRTDAYVSVESIQPSPKTVSVNWPLLDALCDAEREAMKRHGSAQVDGLQSVAHWMTYPDVVQVSSIPDDESIVREDVLTAADQACETLIQMRTREGQRLQQDLRQKLSELHQVVKQLTERAPAALETTRTRLRDRLAESSVSVEDSRWMAEVAMLAERMAIDEELVRLQSHCDEFLVSMEGGSPVGRRLDFIVQEMHREINTIGSKSSDTAIGKAVVEAKTIVEQLREQAQNIE